MIDNIWYHGSPLQLTVLRQGSTITPHRHLAEVFSHKPTLVCWNDDGSLQHNGALAGFLYRVAGAVDEGDVLPHPRSAMPAGAEWLITRDLPLELLWPVPVIAQEVLTEQQVERLRAGVKG